MLFLTGKARPIRAARAALAGGGTARRASAPSTSRGTQGLPSSTLTERLSALTSLAEIPAPQLEWLAEPGERRG
jgi:hypothetical protein